MEKIIWNQTEFNDVKIEKMHEKEGTKEICITFAKNSAMQKHTAPGAISVQVLRGEIEFSTKEQTITLGELDMLTLPPHVEHALVATKDSIVRLSLSKNDDVKRVFSVLKK